ncbi:RagB/SusD family nutrient uptake outer membrane protein [Pedobacter gandavensis]|uniref:RagB/SusD family nutrient uptake outer membrane protein n=1 Tax=Pedobacter gandavensis TaxID=2679963 RepID=UPI002931B15E|nr:RagB/SusD family nutrient uptake outer membrane protein [Pedobacter gandavensis]
MRTFLNKIFIASAVLIFMGGCKKLEVLPPSEVAAETFWKTEKDAWSGLNACYSQLPGWDGYIEMTTDNSHSQKSWEGPFEATQLNALSSADDLGYSYIDIRIQNNFLEKVEGCTMDNDLRNRMKAESRFMRAFSYLKLTSYFGKVPLVTSVLAYNAPPLPRDPVEKVQKFILDELAEIAEILPQDYAGGYLKEKGRITRSGALALRARAALYFGNFIEAEKSANLIINEGQHELFRVTTLDAPQQKEADEMDQYIDFAAKGIDKDKFVKGLFSYETLWHGKNANTNNKEYVVTKGYMAEKNQSDVSRYIYMRPSQLVSGYSSLKPVQDLVDAYWDIDGKTVRPLIATQTRATNFAAIETQVSGLDQTQYIAKVPTLNLKSAPYMGEFRNRDSRLYASILFPFKGWHETDFSGAFYYRWDPAFVNDGNESSSGYSWRKMVALQPYFSDPGEGSSGDDFPVIRYAEVLLTYAEARIQNIGWDTDVQTALNDLRDRCGMPAVPIVMSSKTAALDFVRNERRIEMAGEGNRFYDVRRYGATYAASVMNRETFAPNGYPVVKKSWDNRLLLFPIPQSAMDLNPLLKNDQNAGY